MRGLKGNLMDSKVVEGDARDNRSTPIIVPKNSANQLQLSRRKYEGYRYADLRVHFRNDADEFVPTRKGLTIKPATWPDFVEVVFELDRQLRAEGLVKLEGESNGFDAS